MNFNEIIFICHFVAESEFQNSNVGGKKLENGVGADFEKSSTLIIIVLYYMIISRLWRKGHTKKFKIFSSEKLFISSALKKSTPKFFLLLFMSYNEKL